MTRAFFLRCTAAVTSIGAAFGVASSALAQEPPSLRPLLDCRNIEADAERLACFDTAVAGITGGGRDGGEQLVVVDLQDAEEIEQDSFGLDLPALPRLSLSILSARDRLGLSTESPDSPDAQGAPGRTPPDAASQAQSEEARPTRVLERDEEGGIERIELVVEEIRRRGYDDVEIVMANGQVWRIVGGSNAGLLVRRIRSGDTAVIRRAAMSSYLLQFNDRGAAYRVDRAR